MEESARSPGAQSGTASSRLRPSCGNDDGRAELAFVTSLPGVQPIASHIEVVGQATPLSSLPEVEGSVLLTHLLPPSVVRRATAPGPLSSRPGPGKRGRGQAKRVTATAVEVSPTASQAEVEDRQSHRYPLGCRELLAHHLAPPSVVRRPPPSPQCLRRWLAGRGRGTGEGIEGFNGGGG